MTSKTISFKKPVTLTKPAEEWVGMSGKTPPKTLTKPDSRTKRLTIDVPEDLHRRMKVECAEKDKLISDVVRKLLAKEFPVS